MDKFSKLTGKVAYLPIANIDTDMIIPKQYLKTIKRSGLGRYLFAEMRYDMQGNTIEDFILNKQPDTKILISGDNFGCGSSREHAPWALLDFGIRAIIAPGYADIFYNNCFKNGILPIKLQQCDIDGLLTKKADVTIDLYSQTIQCVDATYFFVMDDHQKEILLQGLDDIEKVLKYKAEIIHFEKNYFSNYPWLERGDHV